MLMWKSNLGQSRAKQMSIENLYIHSGTRIGFVSRQVAQCLFLTQLIVHFIFFYFFECQLCAVPIDFSPVLHNLKNFD